MQECIPTRVWQTDRQTDRPNGDSTYKNKIHKIKRNSKNRVGQYGHMTDWHHSVVVCGRRAGGAA